MKQEKYEQLKIDVDLPPKMDNKAFCEQKQAETDQKKKTLRTYSGSQERTIAEESKKEGLPSLMFEFIKLTLSNKMRICEKHNITTKTTMYGKVVDFYVRHPLVISGAGQVRYAFGDFSCKYEDWMGNVIDYSKAWAEFQEKHAVAESENDL